MPMARAGAPDTVQVTDRFQLVKNGSEALDEVVRSRRRRVEYAEPADAIDTPPIVPEPPLSHTKHEQLAHRAHRRARWQQVRDLRDAGGRIQWIARQQGCHNVAHLFRELEAQGYPGSRSSLHQALQPWCPPRAPR